MSAPVKTATTPGRRRASATSMLRMVACAAGLRTNVRVQHVGHGDVVDVAAVPGEQPGVFDPRDLRPHEPAGNRLTHVVPVRRDPEPTV